MFGENDIVSAEEYEHGETESTPLLQPSTSSARMVEKSMGVSQQMLVTGEGKKLPQYIAGTAASLGALAAGMVLGWSAAAGKDGIVLSKEYNIPISSEEFSWIGSLMTLGAAFICVPIGVLCDLIGRKTAMLALVVPFTIGWLLILFANSVMMFYLGRFITGVSGGAFCVTAPMYTAEISESSIRGKLGSYFQLLLSIGIVISYSLGSVLNIYNLTLVSAAMPIVFFCIFFFMPETPIYYLKKGNKDAARASLVRLRGPLYNVEPEIQMHEEIIAEAERNKVSFFQAIKSKAAIKGLIIGFGLMFFQQMSGVNAIVFYASAIFESADKNIPASLSAIVIGVMQIISVFISTLIVDKLGRRILLLVSSVAVILGTFILGTHFYLQAKTSIDVSNIGWVPLLSICVFIFLFGLGFGPIPWMMMGEIFSSTVKGIAGSSACLFNWLMAFVVTKYYAPLEAVAGNYTCFWLFSGLSTVGIVFIYFVVPETKGKSLEEIQLELGGQSISTMRQNGTKA